MHIIIIGGGFGGVYTAKYLRKEKVTLISKRNHFLFTPMLHEVAGGGMCAHNLVEPIREILNCNFINEEVKKIDLKNKKVILKNKEIEYDKLIIATGSKTNYYNVKGAEKTLGLKSIEDAHTIKNRIIQSVEKGLDDKSYWQTVVVGAGPTGVETAAEIKQLAKQVMNVPYEVKLVGEILPHTSKWMQKKAKKQLKKIGVELAEGKITEVTKHGVKTNNGFIEAKNVIWAAGVKPIKLTEKKVDEYLQINKDVYVIGDCCEQGPMLAQTAVKQAKTAAKNIQGKKRKFKYKPKGFLISIGRNYGLGEIGVRISGFPAWWLMRTIYLFKVIGTMNKLRLAAEWTMHLFMKRDTTLINH